MAFPAAGHKHDASDIQSGSISKARLVDFTFYMNDLEDVDAPAPSPNDRLEYNSGTGKWETVSGTGAVTFAESESGGLSESSDTLKVDSDFFYLSSGGDNNPILSLTDHVDAAIVLRSSDKTINDASWTLIDWDEEELDNNGLHDNVTNNSRLTAARTGLYSVVCNVTYVADATGVRGIEIQKNSNGVFQESNAFVQAFAPGSGFEGSVVGSGQIFLRAGDYVEAFTIQNSGGNLNLHGSTDVRSRFSMSFLGSV